MTTTTIDKATIRALGLAAYNMRFERFCEIIDNEPDYWARDKFAHLISLGRALANFDDDTLVRLAETYAEEAAK